MNEKRNPTKEDEFLKIRLFSEGARYSVKGELQFGVTDYRVEPIIIFDDISMACETRQNPHSSLVLTFDGNGVTIGEMGEVLGTATLEPRAPWRDKLMSDGTTVDSVFYGNTMTSNIFLSQGCYPASLGKGCKFCGLSALTTPVPQIPLDEQLKTAERQVEATVIAIQNGWRGIVNFIGGAQPPNRRDQWQTDLLEGIMARFHELLDGDRLSQQGFQTSVYPPRDFGQLHKWKRLGITNPEFDTQVMDPDYYKAICPGRGEKQYWYEAQEAAVEVFGSCMSLVVTGIEPMAGLLEGWEERTSKGVYCVSTMFKPWPESVMGEMQPPSAEWYQEAFGKIDEIHARYGRTTKTGPKLESELARE